jgi:hypothetical protein
MNNINDVLRELSIRALSLHPGANEACNWLRQLRKRKSLRFVWETELINSKYMPEWVTIKDAKLGYEISRNSRRWPEFRKDEWKRITGSPITIQGQIFYSNTNTSPELATVPTKEATRQLFTMILETIPSIIYEWCEDYEKLLPNLMEDAEITLDREHGLFIWPGVLQFTIAKYMSHSTLHHNEVPKIMDIKSTLPEIEEIENQYIRDRNNPILNPPLQGYRPVRSRQELREIIGNHLDRLMQEAEPEIAAENSQTDEEGQKTLQEENAT